jgi:hypothetical protein
MMQQMIGKLAPAEAAQEGLASSIFGYARPSGGMAHGMPNLVRAELAEMQMRRKARGGGGIEIVAVVRITRNPLSDEILESRVRRLLARPPRRAQTACPIGLGREQLETFQPFALGRREARAFRCRQRRPRRRREACLPKRREHAKRLTAPCHDRPGLEQQPAAEQSELGVFGLAKVLDGLFEFRLPGLVAARGIDGRGPGLVQEIAEHFWGRAAPQAEFPVKPRQITVERGKTAVEPPARGAARTEAPRRVVIENINREDRRAGLCRFGQRRMVCEPEIEAKPHDDGTVSQSLDRRRARQSPRAAASAASW